MRNVFKSLLIAGVLALAASLVNGQKLAADVVECPALNESSFHKALKNAVQQGRKSYIEIKGDTWWIDTDMVEPLKGKTEPKGKHDTRFSFKNVDRKASEEKKIRCTYETSKYNVYVNVKNTKIEDLGFTLTYQL